MSQLVPILTRKLQSEGHMSFLGSDGYQINAQALNGTYSLEVIKPNGNPELVCFSDVRRIMNQVVRHA